MKYIYKNRVVADSGTLKNDANTLRYLKNSDYQDSLDNIKFAWFGEAGSKIRTSGINSYVTKAYTTNYNSTPRYSNELVVNGGFDTDTNWIKTDPTVTISGGVAHFLNTGAYKGVSLPDILTVGKKYRITYTVLNYVIGSVRFQDGFAGALTTSSNGTFTTEYIAGGTGGTFATNALTVNTFDLDNVSVVEVLQDGSITDATQTTELSQPNLSGNIAPNERLALSNANGQSKFITHPTISFAANEAWSISTVFNWNSTNNSSVDAYLFSAVSPYKNTFALQAGVRGRFYLSGNNNFFQSISTNSFKIIGKNTILTLVYNGSSSVKLYLDGVLTETFTITDSFVFSNILESQTAFKAFGKLYAHVIRSGALTQSQITSEFNFFRAIYPEIETVKIGTQDWATSNLDMVCTPQGNVIQEMQANANVEKVTNIADREFSSDTGNWIKSSSGVIISGGKATMNYSSDCYLYQPILLLNTWYKITYTIVLRSGEIRLGQNMIYHRIISTAGTYTYTEYFKSIGTDNKFIFRSDNIDADIDNVSVQEIGWASSTELYDAIYAQTVGTVEQKTYAAVKAAAMWSYYNNDAALGSVYGKLYNGYAAKLLQMDIDYFNVANPTALWGYRVPADTDFNTLVTGLGADQQEATNKFRVVGTTYWVSPDTGTNNSSGFSALGGGARAWSSGVFSGLNYVSAYWGYTNMDRLYCTKTSLAVSSSDKGEGKSIRLIKQ